MTYDQSKTTPVEKFANDDREILRAFDCSNLEQHSSVYANQAYEAIRVHYGISMLVHTISTLCSLIPLIPRLTLLCRILSSAATFP